MSFLIPGIVDIIDILIIAALLYRVFILVRDTIGYPVIISLGIIVLLYFFAVVLDMKLLTLLLKLLRDHWIIAFLVLFQPEIRSVIHKIGFRTLFQRRKIYLFAPILKAIATMAFKKTGALILIEGKQKLNEYISSGEIIDARLSTKLILTIFNSKTILHDGAVVIRGARIFAVKVILPVSHNLVYLQQYGTRHLAALGVTEHSDCLAIVVSEETGRISVARNGEIRSNLSTEELAQIIADETKS
ncbi:MAG: diadenylate cyclase CdaA [Candidatus Cloacimonetes bacterium]|nr:diadenylate cyclase CdaA [Candidatus Cloacimonadota bacterium]